jgi:hypothetical protein
MALARLTMATGQSGYKRKDTLQGKLARMQIPLRSICTVYLQRYIFRKHMILGKIEAPDRYAV